MKVVVFGASVFAELVWYALTNDSEHQVVGFTVDGNYLTNTIMRNLPVVPFEEVEASFPPEEVACITPMSWHGINGLRARKHGLAKEKGYRLISYLSSRATIGRDFLHGENWLVFDGTVIEPFSKIGDGVIIRSGCTVSHHVTIGDHCFLSPGVTVGGGTKIEERCFLGLASVIRSGVKLAPKTFVAAGALVTSDTEENAVYKGVPARKQQITADGISADAN
jgi:sugar O-acyltransferase (sialic acid O-acetyltransferase NeuD family)